MQGTMRLIKEFVRNELPCSEYVRDGDQDEVRRHNYFKATNTHVLVVREVCRRRITGSRIPGGLKRAAPQVFLAVRNVASR